MKALAFAFAVATFGVAFAETEPPLEGKIAALVEEEMGDHGLGIAVLLVENGKVRHMAGYGKANLSSGEPVRTDSVFDLASVSKSFTAVAVLLLEEQGKLALDDPVGKHVRDFQVPVEGRPITIRDLLHHTSGLPDYSSDDWEESDEEFDRLTNPLHLAWLNRQEAEETPGKKYEYNNSGYALLATVVERVSGKRFAEFMRERIFAPLGMSQTLVYDRLGTAVPKTVKGYNSESGSPVSSTKPVQMTGDGNVFTTIADMARWVEGLRSNKLVRRATIERAWKAGALDDGGPIVADEDEGYGYGFGWEVDAKTSSAFHSGSWNGTATYFVYFVDDDVATVVLANDENADATSLGDSIANLRR